MEKTRAAQTAQAIKKELKEKLPAIQFRVVSKNYSGGNSINVSYTDGPTSATVEAITSKYQAGHFDGMIDSYEYSNPREDIPQVDYVFVERTMSDAAKEALIAAHNAKYAPDCAITGDPSKWSDAFNCWESIVLCREFRDQDLTVFPIPAGGLINEWRF